MDIVTVTHFFKWCTIINGGIFLLWTFFLLLTPDLVYRMQSVFFPIPREKYDVVIYSFLGAFKIIFMIFNVTPFIALLIIG